MTNVFPYLVVTLQGCAGGVYVWQGQWRNAVVWVSVAVANFALAGLK